MLAIILNQKIFIQLRAYKPVLIKLCALKIEDIIITEELRLQNNIYSCNITQILLNNFLFKF